MIRKVHMLRRPFVDWSRAAIFGKTEASGINCDGSRATTDLLINDVAAYQNSSNLHAFYDSRNSKGNYIGDVDGNTMLDLCSMENLPLGHNHSAFVSMYNNKAYD